MPSDFSLVMQVAVSGNKRAFDELVRRYQLPVRSFFLHQTMGDSPLSDDLAQDTFIKAYTAIASFRGLASFRTWLMRIAYNVFYDYTRNRHALAQRELTISEHMSAAIPADEGMAAATSAPHATLKLDIYQALAILKEQERTCITLQLIEGYDIASIAKITGMKQGTVKSHLSRGKEKLADYLKHNGYDRR